MTHSTFDGNCCCGLFSFILGAGADCGHKCIPAGKLRQVGVNTCGAFASNAAPPAGYVFTGLSGLNFVADSDLDGWDAGTPNHCGDYAIPGSPVEGWGIQLDGVSYYNTDLGCVSAVFPRDHCNAAGDSVEVIWQGTLSGVTITQRSVLHADDLYFVTWVTLSNESAQILLDVYYRRNIDPDNEQLATGSTPPSIPWKQILSWGDPIPS